MLKWPTFIMPAAKLGRNTRKDCPMRVNAKRIARALGAVADLVEVDPIYVPIFERLSD